MAASVEGVGQETVLDTKTKQVTELSTEALLVLLVVAGCFQLGVSKNRDTPKSCILIGFSIIDHPFWGTPIFGNTQLDSIDIPRFPRLYKYTP